MALQTIRLKIADAVSLIKPRITLLTLITVCSGMWLANHGTMPSFHLLLPVLLGTSLGVSCSCLLNNYYDRYLDRHMERTRDRPLPDGRLSPEGALLCGLVFGTAGVLILGVFANLLSALLLLLSIVNYGFVYTLWLKRETPYSTEVVGLSGALAPVIGWVAVNGSFGWGALSIFLVLYFWQPSHFWCLGILHRDDYQNVNLPRYPVVHGVEKTKQRMLGYTFFLWLASLSLALLPEMEETYLVGVLILGGIYLGMTLRWLRQEMNRRSTLTLFFTSIGYLVGWLFFLVYSSG